MTMQRPLEDRYLLTEPELQDRLAILLGGRTAEEISFNQVSTGAQNDLEKATEIARAMVVEYGMSPKVGPLSYGHDGRMNGNPFGDRPEMSDATARIVDEEVARLVNDAHERATRVLADDRPLLDRLAAVLMVQEVIEGIDLIAYVAGEKPIPEPSEVHPSGNGRGSSGPEIILNPPA
jgi:cell division protease FtsH